LPIDALALALAAAVTHASWNLILAGRRDSEAATAVALAAAIVLAIPVLAFTWQLDTGALPYLATSSACTVGYMLLLSAAYHRAELSLVYPLARGTGPLVALAGAWLVLHQTPSATEALGVVVVAAGILLVRGVGGGGDAAGVLMALGIGCCIGTSVLLDQRGLQHADALTYATVALVAATAVQGATVTRRRGAAALRAELGAMVVLAGVLCILSYVLVLWALDRGPAGPLAAARETSVVVATVMAAIVLREGVTRERLAGAVVVVAGVALLSAA
jgi:drug/metabolite transporter (DMT)-like permease